MIHINEVAKQTKITVRTLRYYDQIGLLTVSSKTEGGHRLYTEEDLKKLQQIQFLKGMGYSLQDINDMLSDPKWNWSNSLKNQLVYIIEEQARLKSIESSLRELINSIAVEGGDDHLAIQKLIRLSLNHKSRLKTFRDSMFSDKEIELWTRLPKMSGEDPDSLEWIALIGQIKRHVNDNPATPKVQSIIRRMQEKQLEDFNDDEEFINKLWDIRKSSVQSEELGLYPIEKEVLDFLERAYEIYISSVQDSSALQGGES
ncbi:MerR family transcriptional regulator [Heyndrickxia oleronia]|uniref:MerR family transcriptional regulator n=1 Tax=Heyndrickxia oleronia TaxID=38875 RepID=A0A8E2LDJ2_9BACI|nr:MerR family transcriptional regulator [Heyndrickxia oleronia]MCI1590237.1 MerR family transcriptional regulator [Heyndrickxia oleronia]MCI1614019.1 MerR family transcriptional regulator [Heyndrickxia oleronia]MCI1744329.1 MerR family transcriptional regulator [Heyndrickxia oleronia]MCI1761881.1 MerR family transcriptional regulator [Heyndrickxia oleronia]MDH5163663.1 MerR family transcriptional regulator [Heyndrickxia oleronia]